MLLGFYLIHKADLIILDFPCRQEFFMSMTHRLHPYLLIPWAVQSRFCSIKCVLKIDLFSCKDFSLFDKSS